MRHQVRGNRLNRPAAHRRAMLRNMVTSLLKAERITTTVTKAKEARRFTERMITLAKRGDLHARRQAATFINDPKVLQKLFADIGPRYAERPGGYTRVTRVGVRKGDDAPMAVLELVTEDYDPKSKREKKAKPKAAKKAKPKAEAAEESVGEESAGEESVEAKADETGDEGDKKEA